MPSDSPIPPFAGGCQCGAVRYQLTAAPTGIVVCHCRMCQKAGGAPFLAFAGVKLHELVFTRAQPTTFASSDLAERGFCAACGTPLTYHMKGRNRISITIASLDDPAAFPPHDQLGVESRLPWVEKLADLPETRVDDWLAAAKITNVGSHQHPDHE